MQVDSAGSGSQNGESAPETIIGIESEYEMSWRGE